MNRPPMTSSVAFLALLSFVSCGGGSGGGGGGTPPTPMDFVIAFPTNLDLTQLAEGGAADGVSGADPCMSVVPPVSRWASAYAVATPATSPNVAYRYANLVAPSTSVASMTLNGLPVGASAFAPIGATGYSGAAIALPAGTNRFAGDGTPFGILIYGWGQALSENGFSFSPTD